MAQGTSIAAGAMIATLTAGVVAAVGAGIWAVFGKHDKEEEEEEDY